MTDTKQTNDILEDIEKASGEEALSEETARVAESTSELWSENQYNTSDVSEGIEEAFLALIQSEEGENKVEASIRETSVSSEDNNPNTMVAQGTELPQADDISSLLDDNLPSEISLNDGYSELSQNSEPDFNEEFISEIENISNEIPDQIAQEQIPSEFADIHNNDLSASSLHQQNVEVQIPNETTENVYNSEFVNTAIASNQSSLGSPSSLQEQTINQTQTNQNINNVAVNHPQTQPVEFESQQNNSAASHMSQAYGFGNKSQPMGYNPDGNTANPSSGLANQNQVQKANVDPEFQALVQWSNSDIERAHHGHVGPHDIPNFLAQKKVEESKFSFKTVFVTLGISSVVLSMLFIGYQAGRMGSLDTRNGVYDATADNQSEKEIIVEKRDDTASKMFEDTTRADASRQRAIASIKPKAAILKFSVNNLSGTSGKAIPMDIELEGNNLGLETILLLRGIPDRLSLSTGSKREGVWSVPIGDLKKLALVVPNDYQGKFDFEVFAFKDKQSGPERRVATVSIDGLPVQQSIQADQGTIKIASRTVTQQKPETQQPLDVEQNKVSDVPKDQIVKPQSVAIPKVSRSVETSMLRRGNRLLKDGDISGARLMFEHLASQGSKHGAFALARTYDKDFLSKMFVRGLTPEMDKAIKWYKEAATLGHKDAASRLGQLGIQ